MVIRDVVQALTAELETFQRHKESLLRESYDKYVLIHQEELAGTFDTEADAINEGYRRFGNVPFLVKQVCPADKPLNFVSGLVAL